MKEKEVKLSKMMLERKNKRVRYCKGRREGGLGEEETEGRRQTNYKGGGGGGRGVKRVVLLTL